MAPDGQAGGGATAAVPGSVRRAIAYMHADLARPVTGVALARAAGIPERTLRSHFLQFLGLSPLAWLRAARLAAVREALLDPRPGETVAAAADRHGFGHLARFAAAYRRRFGEPPSATLERARSTIAVPGAAALRHHGPTLSVLPLSVAEGAGYEERALARSLPDQLAAALSRLHGIVVRLAAGPRGAAGDARYLLDGRVVRVGDRLRIVLRLLDRTDGAHLWGDAFDGTAAASLALQDRVVAAATEAIEPRIGGAEIARAQRRAPADLAARDLVLRAVPLALAADPDSAGRALVWLGEAMEMDPGDAVAPALAGWCYVQRRIYWRARTGDLEREWAVAEGLSARAMALDPYEPLVLTAASGMAMAAQRFEEGVALVERALAINPRSGWSLERQGWIGCISGESQPALGRFARAMRSKGPHLPIANCLAGIGTAHFMVGRYAQGATYFRQAIANNPSAVWMNRVLLSTHLLAGERSAAEASAKRLRDTYDHLTVSEVYRTLPKPADATECERLRDGLTGLGFPS